MHKTPLICLQKTFNSQLNLRQSLHLSLLIQLPPTPVPSATPYTESKRRIFINLAKLQTATLSSLKDDAIVMETLLPSDRPYVTLSKAGKQEIEPKHLLKFAKQEPKKKVPYRVVLTNGVHTNFCQTHCSPSI